MPKRSYNAADETFEVFHTRQPGQGAFPLQHLGGSRARIDVSLPHMTRVGKAMCVLYDSDKWNELGDVIGYYHMHGPEDGAHAFTELNKVEVYVPQAYISRSSRARLPIKWTNEIVLLGACSGWTAETPSGQGKQGDVTDSILCCSPFGYVSSSDRKRVFLSVIDVDDWVVEAIICGPGLRVTKGGIEG